MTMKTPEQIAYRQVESISEHVPLDEDAQSFWINQIREAIEHDRAQRQPEIYIVQNDAGDVVDVFRHADEATAAYQEGYAVIEETVWEDGEYAAARIAALTAEWQEATGDTASDYRLSEDDWRVGLPADDAAEITRLIQWQEDYA